MTTTSASWSSSRSTTSRRTSVSSRSNGPVKTSRSSSSDATFTATSLASGWLAAVKSLIEEAIDGARHGTVRASGRTAQVVVVLVDEHTTDHGVARAGPAELRRQVDDPGHAAGQQPAPPGSARRRPAPAPAAPRTPARPRRGGPPPCRRTARCRTRRPGRRGSRRCAAPTPAAAPTARRSPATRVANRVCARRGHDQRPRARRDEHGLHLPDDRPATPSRARSIPGHHDAPTGAASEYSQPDLASWITRQRRAWATTSSVARQRDPAPRRTRRMRARAAGSPRATAA